MHTSIHMPTMSNHVLNIYHTCLHLVGHHGPSNCMCRAIPSIRIFIMLKAKLICLKHMTFLGDVVLNINNMHGKKLYIVCTIWRCYHSLQTINKSKSIIQEMNIILCIYIIQFQIYFLCNIKLGGGSSVGQ